MERKSIKNKEEGNERGSFWKEKREERRDELYGETNSEDSSHSFP